MKVKSSFALLILMFAFIFGGFIFSEQKAFAAQRRKSAVITVYNNLSGTTYNKALDKVVQKELQRRLEGLYIELDSEPYAAKFRGKSLSDADLFDVVNAVKDSGADYLVYVELLPFDKHGTNYVAHFDKNMTASVFLWLIDVKQGKEFYKGSFSMASKDSSADWYVGNKSVALKALDGIMFKVGELISAKLPL